MCFSEKLTAIMRQKRISTRQLSEMTGIPKSAIQRYTTGGTNKIPIDRLKLMAEALSIDPASIMGWDTRPAPAAPASAPDPIETELVDIYRGLNATGQTTLIGTARGLAANPDMQKNTASQKPTA